MRDYTSTIRDLNPFPWIFKSTYKVNYEEIEDKLLGYINTVNTYGGVSGCLLYTSPSPRDGLLSRMPSSA